MPRASRAPFQTPLGVMLRGLVARAPSARIALRMPGRSHKGPLSPATPAQIALAMELRTDVEHLALSIGERNVLHPHLLQEAEIWLGQQLARTGYAVRRQACDIAGVSCANLDAEIPGRERPEEIVIIGAHYDAVGGCPAANDNGSGVAAVLALARRFAGTTPRRTLRFALFVNEEPPFFWTEAMGSLVYARACKARNENIVAMLTPETIGCYLDERGSQKYPLRAIGLAYPTRGNFIAFLGMGESAGLVRRCVGEFRRTTPFPSIGAALPAIIPGVGASDHWSFWQLGYPALMVTDTAPFRYVHYHQKSDTPDKMDFERMARVVSGLEHVVRDLADGA